MFSNPEGSGVEYRNNAFALHSHILNIYRDVEKLFQHIRHYIFFLHIRYKDLENDVIGATSIGSLRNWPVKNDVGKFSFCLYKILVGVLFPAFQEFFLFISV